MATVDDERSERTKRRRTIREHLQMLHRLLCQHVGLRASAFHPQHRDERRLASTLIFARALADLLVVALDIKKIVDDLECEAEIVRIGTQGMARAVAGFAEHRAGFAENAMSAPVFMRCNRVISAISSGICSARRSSIWPPTIPSAPAAFASSPTRSLRTRGSGCSRFGDHLEGPREQCIAGENRCRFVEFDVARRQSAPQVVIVHRRQIIMDQRIAVHHLDRGRHA